MSTTVTYSTWWVSLLIFIPYAILLYAAHASFQRHVFHHTLIIIGLFFCITPFYFYPIGITETYIILKYFVITIFLLLISFMRIQKYKQVQLKTDFQRLMWKISISSCCYSEKTMFVMFYVLSILNIFDSILIEYFNQYYFNSLCGIFLCVTIPIPKKIAYPINEWFIETKSGFYQLNVRLRFSWILLYTSWNLCFIYTIFPTHLIKHGFIVFIPLIKCIFDKSKKCNVWLSARIYTQSLFYFGYLVICVYEFTSNYIMKSNIDQILEKNVLNKIDTSINNKLFINIWAVFNFILSIIYTVWWFRWVCRQNAKKYQMIDTEDDIDGEFGALHTDKCQDTDDDDDFQVAELTDINDRILPQ